MSILEQYEKQFGTPAAPAPRYQASNEYGFLINLVMRLSGGRIKDATQASYMLLGFSVIIIIFSVVLFLNAGKSNTLPPIYKVNKALEDTIKKLQ